MKKLISIIIPCYNEEETIDKLYKEIIKVTKKIKEVNFELLFIDDGSKDKTLKIVKKLSEKDNKVRYVSFSRNFGKEAAMYAGLKESKGDYVAIIDADMQDPPEKIIEMYEILKEKEYDCVALYTKKHRDYNFIRRFLTFIWYKIIKVLASVEQKPGARDYRLMTRQMVDAILDLEEYNRYSKGIFSFVGFNTKWLEVETNNRIAGKSKFNLYKLFKYSLEGIIAFSTKPLVLSAILGLFLCLIAFIFIIIIIVKTVIYGDPVSGWPSLACIVIFIGGLNLFFMGILGLYLSKTYSEVKNRPIYIVKEKK